MTPIMGFAPDADPTVAGVLTDCLSLIPYASGYLAAPSPVAVSAAALAAECRGAVVATKLDGSRRLFAGTQTKLYELSGGTWTDRSAAGSYVGSTESRWSYCQFGDTSIASNLADAMQSSAAGSFAAISGAPKAKIVVSASNNFVIAFNTNDATFGVSPDRWWNCAQSDQTNWTPSVATGATTGRLVAREGQITAALPLGDYIVAYKSRGLFLGSFVGAANGSWQWPVVPGTECGAVGQEAVCDIGGVHFIVGEDDFWLFDGTRPQPLTEGICRDWFRANSSQTFRYRTKCTYDRQRNIVRIAYPSPGSTGACDRSLVYHCSTKKFGVDNVVQEAALNFIAPGVTIDGLDAYASTIDALPPIPFDSQYWLSGGRLFAYFDSSHKLVTATGPAGPSMLTTGDSGDDDSVSAIDRFRVRFARAPLTATATGLVAMNEGEPMLASGAVCAMNEGKFDLRQEGRFHRVRLDMTGDLMATGYDIKLKATAGR
ncbi:hypothetical protein [Variovorax sp. PBL-E5]|uniref:hypothetical protein n=1 Tax=Variovorax sp. PBL-E5 TaxID=434014 RepID=UPI0013191B78|nr:hypothetical protein [Variovorax sp. PBL-E5]VTU37022.1 hypothetical protein E5CHR_04464 [Variovorax sp. PBL-E5]